MDISDSILLSTCTILLSCGVALIIFIVVTCCYLKLYWKKNKAKFNSSFWFSGLWGALLDKFYESLAFGISILALTFGIFSMINSGKLERAKFEVPDIRVKAVKYEVNKNEELKLVIIIQSGIKPIKSRIEIIPVLNPR